jgi:hypothetical protein
LRRSSDPFPVSRPRDPPWSELSRTLGIDDDQPLEPGDVAQPLIGADEPVDRRDLVELESDAELEGIEGANLAVGP